MRISDWSSDVCSSDLTASRTEVRTDTSTEESYTPAAALLTQTYTATQNGVSGGFVVLGGLDNDPTGEGAVKTSDVTATINLNSGSATLGSIFGEVDEDGNRTTNTTVNLVGSTAGRRVGKEGVGACRVRWST